MINIEEVFVFGNSGHAKVIEEIIYSIGEYGVCEFIDEEKEEQIDELIKKHKTNLAVLGIGDNKIRAKIVEKFGSKLEFIKVIHPEAIISPSAEIGDGTVVMAGAVVQTGAIVGEHCVINTKASIDHDSVMKDFSFLGPGATTGGNVKIGERSWVGLGASVIQNINIGKDTIIGAGSVVVRDIPDGVTAYGVPCKVKL
jgi:sugar O-acyltransferase (sialic acid O-acetyltransferase NeuD family)